MKRYTLLIIILLFSANVIQAQKVLYTDVLVVGGGTGGTAAGLQSARLGASTIIVETSPWLGGMLSAAGVTATDGNHNLPSGIWNEFREALYKIYGGPNKVFTGWVSNTQFEPHKADSIFKSWAKAEKKLQVFYEYQFTKTISKGNKLVAVTFSHVTNKQQLTIYAKQIIDATDLGDVMASADAKFDIGMESDAISGEKMGITQSTDIVQDLTYAAILKDYGKGADKTIPKPANYSPSEFDGACTDYYIDKTKKAPTVNAQKMLEYGKLPNNKYMINWPGNGNDYYVNNILMTQSQRDSVLELAKQQTLRFVYFIQHQLGYKNLGFADDEFDTKDKFPYIPYYRESRRLKGLVRVNINHILQPFNFDLYKTGIAVGDYPIDHHHKKNPHAPQHLEFAPVPSFNVPLGALIPQNIQGLIVAEKNISVSNVVNGTTRLQPCVLLIGQAAGSLAALAVKQQASAAKVPVRKVQQALLNSKAMIMPYIDAGIQHPQFKAIQRVGATGILKGEGKPYKWANQTWFYPDSTIHETEFFAGIQSFNAAYLRNEKLLPQQLTTDRAIYLIEKILRNSKTSIHKNAANKTNYAEQMKTTLLNEKVYTPIITRKALALLIDTYINPFFLQSIQHNGKFFTTL
ncbi:MAG: FAD-dependent oxidoreductase [Chitinophagaceae bacterium]